MARKVNDVRGMTAVVTGASSGIGLCFTRHLAAMGCRLVMISNQPDELEKYASEIRAEYGSDVLILCLDLTLPDATKRVLTFLESNRLAPDILINNAGIFSFRPLTDIPERKLNMFIDLHVRTVTSLTREFGRLMQGRGRGFILNMSSMSCWMPMPGLSMYASTKAYIRVFTRSVHYEMRDAGVSVMAACPGGIATDLFGLPPGLMKLALRIHALQTPEKFTEKALRTLFKGKKQYINGWLNRLSIFFVGIMPTPVRMLVKRRMLDKNIIRP